MSDPASNPDAAAASSPAAPSSSPVDLEALHANDPAAYERWKLTGEAPASDVSAGSSPDAPATEQAASTEATPSQSASAADAPGAAELKPGTPEYKAKTKERMDAILQERDQARRETADLRRQLEARNSADPSKPKSTIDSNATPDLQKFVEEPVATALRLTSDRFFEQFPDATFDDFQLYLTNHVLATRDHAAQQRESRQREETAQKGRVDAFVARISDPEFVKTVLDLPLPVELLESGMTATGRNYVAQEIMESENGKAMWQALTEADLAEVDKMTDSRSVIRFCARLEARVAGAPVKAGKPVAPSKTVSDAPDPGTEIGSKAKSPSDPIAQALEDDDFVKYRDLANAAEMKR